jgi:hypothetical protein
MPQAKHRSTQSLPELRHIHKTRLGNSLGELPNVDGRSMIARRYRELVHDLADHLGNDPTPSQLAILKRAAALQAWCEHAEGQFAETGELEGPEIRTHDGRPNEEVYTELNLSNGYQT